MAAAPPRPASVAASTEYPRRGHGAAATHLHGILHGVIRRSRRYFNERFENFDVANASCYDPVQSDRLLGIIEAGFGGLPEFNSALKTTMDALQRRSAATTPAGRAGGESRPRGRSFTFA